MKTLVKSNLNIDRQLKKWQRTLFILLLLMIAGFFTWSENVAITRAFKVVGRNGVLIYVIYLYYQIQSFGLVDTLKLKNKYAPLLYIGYLGLGLISIVWSTDKGYSGLQWFMITQSLVFSYYFIRIIMLIRLYFPDSSIRLTKIMGNCILILIGIFVVGMYVDPDTFFRLTNGGEEARLGGYMMNPNELGMLAGVGVACFIYELTISGAKNKWWILVKLFILFYALFYTGSRSSLIGGLLIVSFYIFQSERKQLKLAMISAMLIVAPFAIWTVVLKGGDSSRMEEVMSMTGRLPFWQALISEGLPREPLFGFGFMRIDYKDFFQSTHTYPGKMTHNTFMQVLMNLGFVGLIIALTQVVTTIRGFLKEEKNQKYLLIGLFIPILINSFTEFGIFGESNYGILFYQLCIFMIVFEKRKYFTRAEKLRIDMFTEKLKLAEL